LQIHQKVLTATAGTANPTNYYLLAKFLSKIYIFYKILLNYFLVLSSFLFKGNNSKLNKCFATKGFLVVVIIFKFII